MVASIVNEFVTNSRVYRDVKADVRIQENGTYLSICHEGVIKLTEDIDDQIYIPWDACGISKGFPAHPEDIDESTYMHELMCNVASLCGGPFANSTLCQYMFDAKLRVCQMRIAETHKSFYDKVDDKETIFPEVRTYLRMVS